MDILLIYLPASPRVSLSLQESHFWAAGSRHTAPQPWWSYYGGGAPALVALTSPHIEDGCISLGLASFLSLFHASEPSSIHDRQPPPLSSLDTDGGHMASTGQHVVDDCL